MAKVFFREKNDSGHAVGSRGSIRQAILLVLLLITAGLGYLYFFTGLIRPREHIEIAPSSAVPPVKQPLPPRLTQEAVEQASTAAEEEKREVVPAKTEETAPVSPPAGSKPAAVPAAKPEAPQAAKPAPPPVAKPTAHPAVKPAAVPAAKTAASPASKPAPPQIKPQPGKAAKAGEKPAAKADIKTQTVSPKPAKGSETKPAGVSAAKDNRPGQAVKEGKYTLLIGGLAGSKEADKIRTRLQKQGITDITVRKVKKTETMHRIFLGEFDNQAAANAEFNQLKTQADGAFVLRENDRYLLYAGSYLHEAKAKEELKRLAGKGFKPGLRSAKVSITVNEVLAGSFPGSGEARKEADRLKKMGIVSRVIKTGK